jgi:mannitol/fructose-specific phosphotransferase system IIA component (Ntr-type)
MLPWARVRSLSSASTRDDVLRQIARFRFSRWPVVDAKTGRPMGYLLSTDLLSQAAADAQWGELIRPLPAVRRDDTIEIAMRQFQREDTTICAVLEGETPLGLLTLNDILEKAVGRVQQEFARDPALVLRNALEAGPVLLGLQAGRGYNAILELAAAIPPHALPRDTNVAELVLSHGNEVSFDLGCGVAFPHARCPRLPAPIVAVGISPEGIIFSPESRDLVRLVFLLVSPSEDPALHLLMLGQLAEIAGNAHTRERVLAATSPSEVIDLLLGTESPAAFADRS